LAIKCWTYDSGTDLQQVLVVFVSLATSLEQTAAEDKSPLDCELLLQVDFFSQGNQLLELSQITVEAILVEGLFTLQLVLIVFKLLQEVLALFLE